MKNSTIMFAVAMLFLAASQAIGQTPAPAPVAATSDAAALFKSRCGDCHDPAVGEAPEKSVLAAMKAEDIFTTLKSGLMQPMAEGLTDDQMKAIAAYLTTLPAKPAP